MKTYIVEAEWLETDMMNYEYSYRRSKVFDNFDAAKKFAESVKMEVDAQADDEDEAYDDDDDEADGKCHICGITRIVIWSRTEDGEKDWKEWGAWEGGW